MSDQQKPVQDTAELLKTLLQVMLAEREQKAKPGGEDTSIKDLVQLMLAERQENLEARQAKAQAILEREKQRRINAEYQLKEKREAQSICTHKKGGKGLKGPKVDYAVSYHIFVDGSAYIRCLICGMKWKNTDTSEHLIRRGEKIPNHTGISWRDAYRMTEESSNTATSSEVKIATKPITHELENFINNPRAVEI
jgi:hypothetical protein